MTNHTHEPCPWCGCKEIEISFSEICCPIQYSARGRCTECHAEDPDGSGVFDSKEDAEIEARASWNDRPADQIAAVTAQRDELLEVLKTLKESYLEAGEQMSREQRIAGRNALLAASTAIAKCEVKP